MDSNIENKERIVQIQRFTASCVSLLNLLRDSCAKRESTKARVKFIESCETLLSQVKNDDNFDYSKFVKKAFDMLKIEQHSKYLETKDKSLFEVRDSEKRIMTIISGLDVKVGYSCLDEKECVQFWQYLYLYSSAVFNLINLANNNAYSGKYAHVKKTLEFVENDIAKTGIMFNNQIFNPFLGIESNGELNLDKMFESNELPKQGNISIESMLSLLGVEKMFDEGKINEELKNIDESQVVEATDKIIDLLGANNNPEVREVCNTLITDIIANFKQNGLSNIGDTLKNVAENARNKIDVNKMKKTADSMKYFMNNSQDIMKDMKDANGKPIGQQLLNSMSIPLNMINSMNDTKK